MCKKTHKLSVNVTIPVHVLHCLCAELQDSFTQEMSWVMFSQSDVQDQRNNGTNRTFWLTALNAVCVAVWDQSGSSLTQQQPRPLPVWWILIPLTAHRKHRRNLLVGGDKASKGYVENKVTIIPHRANITAWRHNCKRKAAATTKETGQ